MFQNPYFTAETGLKGHHRVNISISESDWSYIKGLRLGGGTITTTISILFKCLTDELIKRLLFYLFCLCSFFLVVFDDGLSATFEVLPHGGCVSAKTTKMNDESSSLVVSHVLERTVDELFEGFLHQEEVR